MCTFSSLIQYDETVGNIIIIKGNAIQCNMQQSDMQIDNLSLNCSLKYVIFILMSKFLLFMFFEVQAVKNIIKSGSGNDLVVSIGGGDDLDGGSGSDTLRLSGLVTDFTINLLDGGGFKFSKGGSLYADAKNFETFEFKSSTNSKIEKLCSVWSRAKTYGNWSNYFSTSSFSCLKNIN